MKLDQELKQRLVGAAVITALAAFFIPMLFDEPVDETGKTINQLTIPKEPEPKATEKTKLAEKAADIAAIPPVTVSPANANGNIPESSGFETDVEVAPADAQATADEVPPPPATNASPNPTPAANQTVAAANAKSVIKPIKITAATQFQPTQPNEPKPLKKDKKLAAAAKAEEKALKVLQNANPSAPSKVYLQVGTFSQKTNAVTLQESLKQQGFAASIKEVGGEKGAVYRVRIGPVLDKDKAESIKARLAQINVNSIAIAD